MYDTRRLLARVFVWLCVCLTHTLSFEIVDRCRTLMATALAVGSTHWIAGDGWCWCQLSGELAVQFDTGEELAVKVAAGVCPACVRSY